MNSLKANNSSIKKKKKTTTIKRKIMFLELVSKPYYVDKTDYIAMVFEETKGSNLITYPRRWGKTMNLEMIKYYA